MPHQQNCQRQVDRSCLAYHKPTTLINMVSHQLYADSQNIWRHKTEKKKNPQSAKSNFLFLPLDQAGVFNRNETCCFTRCYNKKHQT